MHAPNLVDRIRNYFERRIAWTQGAVEALRHIEEDLAAEAFDRLIDELAQREHQTEAFVREHNGLLVEWRRATDIGEADRSAVQELARQADDLAKELRERYQRASKRMRSEAAKRKDVLDGLRRGRSMLDKYRPGDPGGIGFLNKKA